MSFTYCHSSGRGLEEEEQGWHLLDSGMFNKIILMEQEDKKDPRTTWDLVIVQQLVLFYIKGYTRMEM